MRVLLGGGLIWVDLVAGNKGEKRGGVWLAVEGEKRRDEEGFAGDEREGETMKGNGCWVLFSVSMERRGERRGWGRQV